MAADTRVRAILVEARRLLSMPGGGSWCTGTAARSINGLPVDYYTPSACMWCLTGAVWRAAFNMGDGRGVQKAAIDLLASDPVVRKDHPTTRALQRWNDDVAGYGDVIALIDRAIAREEQHG